jgi:OmpA-OmpF porin, OOP family
MIAAVSAGLAGCAQAPVAPAPAPMPFAAAPDYPTTDAGLVTVAPLRHASDVAVIAPDVEHVIWGRSTLEAAQVTSAVRAPTPPARCADRDGDGVCDDRDRCPDTPRGERVDRLGCTCEMTAVLQFEFDSDELLVADRLVLDRIALRMKEVELIAGEAIGHTDSIGSADYNLDLSKRRALSAVNYLAQQGVTEARIAVRGLGESAPVADNATAEGRALNRRVVLRRLDCGSSP